MPRWTIDSPTTLDFDGVVALRVRVVGGSVAVLATAERPRLDVTEVSGPPLLVTHEAGILTVSYEDLTWDGLRGWLRPQRHSANITITVQRDCPTQLGVVNATAVVSGVSARTSLKSVSGEIMLDGLTGSVDANTVSGNLEAQGLDGDIAFKSVSGDLTLAEGHLSRLDAKTVSGRVTADVDLAPAGEVRVGTVSGEVAIRLPGQTSATVSLRSLSGHVHTDFDGLDSADGPSAKNVAGTLGGGSGKLSVASMSGDVAILRCPGRAAPQASDTPAQEGPARHGPAQASDTPAQDGPARHGPAQASDTPAQDGPARHGPAQAESADQSAAMETGGATKEGEAR
jgi:Putative adhesin